MTRRTSMRKGSRLRLILTAAALAAVLFGCPFFQTSVTIEERIGLFVVDLNAAYRNAGYQNFHPTLTQDYEALKGSDWWTTYFPVAGAADPDYTFVITSQSVASAVLVTIDGGPAVWGGPKDYKLAMATDTENENDWRIQSISQSNEALPPVWTVIAQ